MSFDIEVAEIFESKDLRTLKNNLGIRDDWHEPDEQEVTALVSGDKFDNAGIEGEMRVLILKGGKPSFVVNLATLFAFATEYEEGRSR